MQIAHRKIDGEVQCLKHRTDEGVPARYTSDEKEGGGNLDGGDTVRNRDGVEWRIASELTGANLLSVDPTREPCWPAPTASPLRQALGKRLSG